MNPEYDVKQHPYGQLYLGYPNIGLYKFAPEQLQNINLESSILANDDLIGHIENEIYIENSYIDSLVTPVVAEVDAVLDHHGKTSIQFFEELQPPVLKDLWVNKQKKYEFNPIHKHSGVYSFVIWVDIPYTREEEDAASPYKSNDGRNKSGVFSYSGGPAGWIDLAGSKDWNGVMAVFSASTSHCVYPFYSTDKERITIAGNYAYDNRKSK